MVKMIAKIDGMHCNMCETYVNDQIRKNFRVKKVRSSHMSGESEIIAEEAIPEETLRDTLGAAGYRLIGYTTEPYEKKHWLRW